MLKNLTKTLALAGFTSVVAGFGTIDSTARAEFSPITHATGSIFQTGDTVGEIRVISGDNKSWTQIKPGFGFVTFPVHLAAKSDPGWALNRVWVVQGGELDLENKDIYDSGSITGDTQHKHSGNLQGGALKLTPDERNQIVASCNTNLDPSTQQQPEHEEEAQIPLTLLMQSVLPEGGIVSEGIYLWEDAATTHFPVKVVCEPFTRTMGGPSPEVQIDPDGEKIVQVELGLSANGNAVVGGTFKYEGSCPMGLNLNMRWVTNLGDTLKTYIKHKDLAGQHNWTSQTFEITTNQPAYGGNWKKELTDLMPIPFAGATPSNGSGGANANDLPDGGLAFNPGGGNSGGVNPATGLEASNTGTNGGAERYIGYFKLVAFKNKQIVTLPSIGGGTEDVTVYDAYKSSDWRKYDITCEPKQSTVALDSPDGIQNAPNTGTFNPDDDPAFPQPDPVVDTTFDPATRDLTVPPTHAPKPTGDIVRTNPKANDDNVPARIKALAAEARRKQAAKKKQGGIKHVNNMAKKKQDGIKRVNNAAIKAQQKKLKADAAKRAAQDRARKAAAKRRAAIAAELARKRLAAQLLARKRAAAAAQASQPATRAFTRRKSSSKSFSRSRALRVR